MIDTIIVTTVILYWAITGITLASLCLRDVRRTWGIGLGDVGDALALLLFGFILAPIMLVGWIAKRSKKFD